MRMFPGKTASGRPPVVPRDVPVEFVVVVKKEDGVLYRVRDDVDLPAVDERILPADADPDRVAGSGDSVRPLLAKLVRHGNGPGRRCGFFPAVIDVPEGDVAEDPGTAGGGGGFAWFR